MLVKTKAVVLNTIRYQDKSLIVKCYTISDGLKSYFVHNAYSSASKQKISFFQIGQILDIEADHKNKEALDKFKEVKMSYAFNGISQSIHKQTQLIFIVDFLKSALKEDGQNQGMFTFIETSLMWLDSQPYYPEFHLQFMLFSTKYLGFLPTRKTANEKYFEKIEGVFQSNLSSSCLSETDSVTFNQLLCSSYEAPMSFNKIDRQMLLTTILEYYQWHIADFKWPKSLDILKEIFD
jgi:DNA repair protein RecO (recombination protein O)